jgi:hypothetical protein
MFWSWVSVVSLLALSLSADQSNSKAISLRPNRGPHTEKIELVTNLTFYF